MKKIFGNIINPVNKDNIEFIKDGCILINDFGRIEKKCKKSDSESIKVNTIDYGENYIIPGFIDTHTHIPQYPVIGQGRGELLEWLNDYIFPAEQKFIDTNYALKTYDSFEKNALKSGTTTLVAFSSVHQNALKEIINRVKNIRLFSGNSLMDTGKGELVTSYEDNVKNLNIINNTAQSNSNFQHIISPRYAGNCSFKMMKKAADFASYNNLFIQTHLSENLNEIDYILKLFPNFTNYTEIYEKAGLLSDKSIFAHCIHLSEKEQEKLFKTNSIIAHCPSANIFLKSGIMPLKDYLSKGMKVTLGTDVAAGYTLDMKTEMRSAIESSKILSYFKQTDMMVDGMDVFPMANIVAAEYLGIADETGNLNEGKFADMTIISNQGREYSNIENIINDIIYNESKDSIATYYKGEKVY